MIRRGTGLLTLRDKRIDSVFLGLNNFVFYRKLT